MADYVIVGGGIYGCTVAWELARRGADVLLLEAKTIASGASGGLGERGVRANGRDRRELPLMRLAYDIWPTLHERIGGFTGYRPLGHLHVIERESDLAAAPAQVWLQNQQGIESHLLEAAALRELEPHLSENVIAAIYCPNDGVADHTATTRSMANAAREQGAMIQENARVTGMSRRGERVVAISASIDGEPAEIPVSKQLILLSNSHVAGFVGQGLGIQLPIWRMLPQVMALEARIPPPMTQLIGHAHRTLAIKPLPDGRVMVSGGWRGRWDETTGQANRSLSRSKAIGWRRSRFIRRWRIRLLTRSIPTAPRWSRLTGFRSSTICRARRICWWASAGRGMAGRLRRRWES